MGTGYKGGAREYLSLSDNAAKLKGTELYEYNAGNSYFGIRGRGRYDFIRNIVCENPERTAKGFYDTVTYGGVVVETGNTNCHIVEMKDGTFITYRPVSTSDGSPTVLINVKDSTDNADIGYQKIHFVKGDRDEDGSQVR